MRHAPLLLGLALLTATLGCRQDALQIHTGSIDVGSTKLVSGWQQDAKDQPQFPLFHILFVPPSEPAPGSGTSWSGGSTQTRSDITLQYDYTEFDWNAKRVSISTQPIRVRDRKTIETNGQSFDFENGSLFVR